MAPIDIVISIIKRHEREVEQKEEACMSYRQGKLDAYAELIEEFEGFKKIFN